MIHPLPARLGIDPPIIQAPLARTLSAAQLVAALAEEIKAAE